ncbi:unnamed protein product [Lasius platythorax]|uniref:Cytochrome P450 49a1 n=1 Tax=Lasius platythorax TaxID=488582 RepID=A0AAV2NMA1_9HYME
MIHCLMRSTFVTRYLSLQVYETCFYRSTTKLADTLAANEERKCVPLNTNDIITATVAQSHAIPAMSATVTSSKAMPLLETVNPEIAIEDFEISASKIVPLGHVDKTPLPFEEIPGPMILKLWEKYWRYVPLLGTQLFCSLLISRFTQGRLSWNRNVTPIKYLFDEYGCIVRINGPFVNDIVMIHRPEHIAEVFKQESELPVRSGIDILQHYRLNHRKYRSAGPFSLYKQGLEWLEVKEKVDRPLHETISNYIGKLNSVCGELVNKIRNIRNRQDEVPTNFHQDLTAWGMECFYVMMFNKHLGFLDSSKSTSETTKVIDALITAHMYMSRCETGFQVWRFFETPFAKKLFAACDILDEIIGKYIRQAQNKLQASSLSKQEKSPNAEKNFSLLEKMMIQGIHSDDIAILLMDMIILGVQAVINCEAFLLYFLARNPRIQKRLYDEIISVLPKTDKTTVIKESLENMPYLKACIKESLRLRPAFPYLTRLLSSAISLHGYTIPKGTFVIMANQITSQREENFEDPGKYQPERWLKQNEYASNPYQEYSCLPFGHGIRSCLGKDMAEMQMMLLTAKLVREFTIEYDYADIRSRFLMVNVPNKSLRFRFLDRN